MGNFKTNFILTFLLLLFAVSCKQVDKNLNCHYTLDESQDAFNYPDLKNSNDTDIFAYQLRQLTSKQDSFIHVISGTNYLNKFNEPNLSLRYLGKETLRFSYVPFKGIPINISLNNEEITVKMGQKGSYEIVYNNSRLDSAERFNFFFLQKNFFADAANFSPKRRKYYDSVVNKYPELLSTNYYKRLLEKAIDNNAEKFIYSTKKIKITAQQYCLIIDSLGKTEFKDLPWKVEYSESIADGGGYTFEANTMAKYKLFVCYGLPINSLKITGFCHYLIKLASLEKDIKL